MSESPPNLPALVPNEPPHPEKADTKNRAVQRIKKSSVVVGGTALGVAIGTYFPIIANTLNALSPALTGLTTVAIALLAYFQYQVTRGQRDSMNRQEVLTAASVAAATAAARAADRAYTADNRPRIRIRHIFWNDPSGVGNPVNGPAIYYSLCNEGGVDAKIVSYKITKWVSQRGYLPAAPPYLSARERGPFTLKAGEIRAMYYGESEAEITPEFRRDMLTNERYARENTMWLCGLIIYADATGAFRHMAFCRRYDRETRRFEADFTTADYEHAD